MRLFSKRHAKKEHPTPAPTLSASSGDPVTHDTKAAPSWEWPDLSGITRMAVDGVSSVTGKGVGKLASSAVKSALTSGVSSAANSTMAGRIAMGAAKGAIGEIPGGAFAMSLVSSDKAGGVGRNKDLIDALDRAEALRKSRDNWKTFSCAVIATLLILIAAILLKHK